MKVRNDFVTNSSSSSFIISVKDVDYDFLTDIILRDFYVATRTRWDDESEEEIANQYNKNEIIDNDDANIGLFIKTKREIDDEDDYYFWHKESEEKKLERESKNEEKFYVIDNNCTCRFNWDIVEKIFTNKYNIPWKYGYCD